MFLEHYSVYLTYSLLQLKRLIEYFKLWTIRLNSGVDLVRDVRIGVMSHPLWAGVGHRERPTLLLTKEPELKITKALVSGLWCLVSCSQSNGF